MSVFAYEALDRSGKSVKGEVEAGNRDEAIKKIRAQGQFPRKVNTKSSESAGQSKKIKQATPTAKTKSKGSSFGHVSNKQLTNFTRQFSTLVDAGLPIVKSLHLLAEQQAKTKFRTIIDTVAEDVSSGKSLSDALKEHPRVFDNFYTNMVKAGELGGVLDVIFHRLAEFREKAARLKNKVLAALAYPAFVCFFSGIILLGIIVFIIPKFEVMFKQMNVNLPQATAVLIEIARFIMSPQVFLLIFGFGFIIGLYYLVKYFPKGKYFIDSVKNKIPALGLLRRKAGIASFCRTLGTLIASGVSILEALNIIKAATDDSLIVEDIGKIYNSIREGDSVAEPLRQSKVFDKLVADMVAIGEETGDLDKMLLKIADNYDNDVDNLVSAMMSMLEPLLIVGMAVSIGGIVICLFLPMISMMEGMTK